MLNSNELTLQKKTQCPEGYIIRRAHPTHYGVSSKIAMLNSNEFTLQYIGTHPIPTMDSSKITMLNSNELILYKTTPCPEGYTKSTLLKYGLVTNKKSMYDKLPL